MKKGNTSIKSVADKTINSNNHATNDTSEFQEDSDISNNVRPKNFEDFPGRDKEINEIKIMIDSAKKRGATLDHILLYGPPGLGKTSLAYVIAKEVGSNIKIITGPMLKKNADLISILTSITKRDIVFIDEIHRMSKETQEILYSAMEDFRLDIIIGKGVSARSISIDIPEFTLVGATTKISLLSSPFRDRFGLHLRLDYYSIQDLINIIKRSANILDIEIDEKASDAIAKRSRGTARLAIRYLKRLRDYAIVSGSRKIVFESALIGLKALGIDENGFDNIDRLIIDLLVDRYPKALGIKTISAIVNEDVSTIEDVYEPYLLKQGFIHKTEKGRVATEKARGYKST